MAIRIANPEEMRPATLEPARSIAQINEGVAGRIGQAGRAMGNAVASIGAAFGDMAERQGQISDATNAAKAKLDWYKFDNEAWTGIQQGVGEDGSGWEKTASIYDQGRNEIQSKYPVSNPQKKLELDLFFEKQIAERGFAAARQQRTQAGQYHRGIEDKEIAGAVARIEANPTQETVDALSGPLGELVESGRGLYHNEATIEKRKREIQGALLMGQYRGLIQKDPEAAQELFARIQGGKYEIDQPPRAQSGGGASYNIKPAGGGHAIIDMGQGARFRVSEAHADRFAGLLSDLEAAGVKVDGGQSGGYANRNIAGTNTRSRHADGEAIDINWNENARGAAGKIREVIPPEKIREIAKANGLKWGGDWNNPDDMHFEVDRNADYKPRTGGKAVAAAPASSAITPKLTAYSPQPPGSPREKKEGGYASAVTGPDGTSEVRTLEDLQAGRSKYITIAGDKDQDGREFIIPKIEWVDSKGNKHVSVDVHAVVHDTGKAFRGKGESRFDIAVARGMTDEQMAAQPFTEGGVQMIDAKDYEDQQAAPPVADRAFTKMAGLTPKGTMTDARPGPAMTGRLLPGQEFSVKSKVGDITVTSDQLNALDKTQIRALQAQAKEMATIRQRETVAIAEDMVRKQLLTVEQTGKDHAEFNQSTLDDAYRKDPRKVYDFERKLATAKQVYATTADAANLPTDVIEQRLDNLRTSIVDNAGADPASQAAYDRAERRMKSLISTREKDPARAVTDAKEVRAVLDQIPGGEPKNKAHLFQLVDARLKAQTRLGLPEVPVTKSEARLIVADIIYAPEAKKRDAAKAVAQRVHDTYGSHADKVMASAIKLASGDTQDDDQMLSGALRRIQRESMKSVDEVVKPPAAAPSRGWLDGWFGPAKKPNYFDQYDGAK